ncbi:hypothetical protein E1B28_005094 [Marasmius oreades]|uniref:Uncharacterized protein n=1 Tax=Marasmius oreades TaxID=181124 RepID=A0A9P7V059_9AGAR|nr:uncharacterized protein E1B28_005094 [Marasmius oreades]KAG7097775.1 hypothetical protein E1B28_005094 [Marasmius oreades]
MSSNSTTSIPQESLLFAPMVDVSDAAITPAMLANLYSSKQLCTDAITLIKSRASFNEESAALLKALGESISSLQAVIDEKNSDIEQLKLDVKVREAHIEVGKKISEIHRKAAVEGQEKAQEANHEMMALKQVIQTVGQQDIVSKQGMARLEKEVSALQWKVGDLKSQAKQQQQSYTGLARRAGSLAREALRGRWGNAILMFRGVHQSLSKLRAEILSSFAHKNIISNRARVPVMRLS